MRIEIQAPDVLKANQECTLRAVLFNDSFEPIVVSRNAFVGPNLQAAVSGGLLNPESVEPTFGHAEELLTLSPFTFYGRERTFANFVPGDITVTAYYRAPNEQEFTARKLLRIEAG